MTNIQEQELNYFFETTFNKILSWEERALHQSELKNISVREMHILEACRVLEARRENTMSHLASKLDITQGALTTAVNTLVKKDYLRREKDPKDLRIVLIYLSEKGLKAYEIHKEFHHQMIQGVAAQLDEDSISTLTASLKKLGIFFEEYNR